MKKKINPVGVAEGEDQDAIGHRLLEEATTPLGLTSPMSAV